MTVPVIALFPGQGSQHIGMARSFVLSCDEASARFEAWTGGRPLRTLMTRGPLKDLSATENAQPALALAGALCWAALVNRGIRPVAVAGHSLGELVACHAAGALDLETLATLSAARGRLMQAAATHHPGGMLAIVGLERQQVETLVTELAAEGGLLCLANDNAPDQQVVAGDERMLQVCRDRAEALGARRVIRLTVSGPWHSAAMAAAVAPFRDRLASLPVAAARMPLYSAIDGAPRTEPDALRAVLAEQIVAPVRWHETIRRLRADHPDACFVEVGPGKVLTGLVLAIDRTAQVLTVNDPHGVETVARRLEPAHVAMGEKT